MTRCSAYFMLLAGLFFAPALDAQEDRFKSSTNETFSVSPDEEEPPSFRGSSRVLTEDEEMVDEKKTGFPWISLPKPKLPTLPKPTLPKLSMPTWGSAQSTQKPNKPRVADEPSTWDKLNSGTKSFFAKTKQTLMPWAADDEPSTSRKKTQPTRRTTRSTANKNKPEKKPFFSSWLEPRPEEKEIKTVNDYLALPRVQY